MIIVKKPLNRQALAIEETETKIRQIIKTEYLKGTSKANIKKLVLKAIDEGLKDVKLADLRALSRVSLLDFAERQYREMSRIRGAELLLLLACMKIYDKDNEITKNMSLRKARDIITEHAPKVSERWADYFDIEDTTNVYGVPFQRFSQEYIKDYVKPVYDRLAVQYPFDPDSIPPGARFDEYVKHINSLRNRAELEVRYTGHLENIEQLKEQGVHLVISSSHADCSERCQPWQNRVFSLDGTSGTAPDGRKYVPLEDATDIYYTTKTGKRWKNGLLGFNCRHFLVPYKDGYKFPKPNVKEERKQYGITVKQRQLERNVRYWRTKAVYYKGTPMEKQAKARAVSWNNRYIAFSKANGRAYYPSRTKIL